MLCTPCPWEQSVILLKRDTVSLVYFQCNSLVFCAMWSCLSHRLSMSLGKHHKWISQAAKPLRLQHHLHTHRETHTSKCPSSYCCGTIYKLVCPLLMTVGLWGLEAVFRIWKSHDEGSVDNIFLLLVQLPLKWITPSAFIQYIFNV